MNISSSPSPRRGSSIRGAFSGSATGQCRNALRSDALGDDPGKGPTMGRGRSHGVRRRRRPGAAATRIRKLVETERSQRSTHLRVGRLSSSRTASPTGPAASSLDVRMPGMSGLALQERLADRVDRAPILIITGFGDVPVAGAGDAAGRLRLHREAVQRADADRPDRSCAAGGRAAGRDRGERDEIQVAASSSSRRARSR